jgi:hypothetical protein
MIINSSATEEDEGKKEVRPFVHCYGTTWLILLQYTRPDSNPNEALDVVPCGRS